MPEITLKSIAEHFGVSAATVSRILSRPGYTGREPEKAAEIRLYAQKLDFRPNADALALKKGISVRTESSKEIRCYLANAQVHSFLNILRAVEQQAMACNCIIGHKYFRRDTERLLLDDTCLNSVQTGLVIIGYPGMDTLLDDLYEHYKGNVVFAGLRRVDSPLDQVVCDGYQATWIALEYLYSLNHRRIAYLGRFEEEMRLQTYLEFLKQKNIPVNPDYIFECPMTEDGGLEAAGRIAGMKADMPTSVFCANDIIASGLLRGLTDLNIVVPRDLSLISIDDMMCAQNMRPMLTTVHIPFESMGNFSVKLLVGRLNGEHERMTRVWLPHQLVKRESCKKI